MPYTAKINGFTLVELVMVIIITGILSVVVVPRFIGLETFQARGFYDQTLSMLRYAQKNAIAQHANVFVNVNAPAATLCLTYISDSNCASNDVNQVVLNPANSQKFSIVAPRHITIGSTTSTFSFSALGRPSPDAAVNLSIIGDGITRVIIVERETGYVH
ncbi:pilus assembly FimT family protein [Glaciimonas immobilis]|uniref:MSHA pilin protein MshC n=1 Tax=Glaciimonas immobilis TaxID=728004 RepID=A0A840RP38_9BURK|nr:prepilin-type N-terminal cleavage/methylation domain-containing protein [Glaciimonas immobilis]MBB5198401.1 MSHA pilin protein MshC [Glaciimonas immobilis]